MCEQEQGEDPMEDRHEQDGPTSDTSDNHNGYAPRDPAATAAALVPAADLLEVTASDHGVIS